MKKAFFLIALAVMALAIVPQVMAQDTARMEEIQRQMQQVQADMAAGRITPQQAVTRIEQLNRDFEAARTAREQAIIESTTAFTPAQLQRIEILLDQSKTIEANRHDGRINQAQYERQIAPVNQELQSIYDTVNSPLALTQLEEVEKRIEALWPGAHPGWPTTEEWNRIMSYHGVGPFPQSIGTKASHTIDASGRSWIIYLIGGNQDAIFREMKNQLERAVRGKVIAIEINNNNTYRVELVDPKFNPPRNGFYSTFFMGVGKIANGVSLGAGFFMENNTATRPFPTPIR